MSRKRFQNAHVARRIAPEDLRSGDYVIVHEVVEEFLLERSCAGDPTLQVVRFAVLPSGEPAPLWVREVCLPYVLATTADRRTCMLDTRRHHLVRVRRPFARAFLQHFERNRRSS